MPHPPRLGSLVRRAAVPLAPVVVAVVVAVAAVVAVVAVVAGWRGGASRVYADDVSPEVSALRVPLALRAVLERTNEHGCSQSFASSSAQASLALAVDAAGAATLDVDLASHETFGPSRHRWADGDHDVTHTTELARARFTGTTSRAGEAVLIRFTRVERANVRFTGYGTLPLPPATTSALDARMRCELGRTDVLPATAAAEERATPMQLLQCTFEGNPEPLARFDATAFPFGHGAGVVMRAERHMWDHEVSRHVRRLP